MLRSRTAVPVRHSPGTVASTYAGTDAVTNAYAGESGRHHGSTGKVASAYAGTGAVVNSYVGEPVRYDRSTSTVASAYADTK